MSRILALVALVLVSLMSVPARKIPVFRSGKGLKGALNQGK